MKGCQSDSMLYSKTVCFIARSFIANIIMYIPWKSKHFGVCFAKSFVFYAIRRGAEADFVNIHKCAPFDSSFLYRSMHPGLAVKGGFAHSSATNGFLDDYFFSSCSFTVFSNCSGGSIGGLPNFTPLAFAAAIPSA